MRIPSHHSHRRTPQVARDRYALAAATEPGLDVRDVARVLARGDANGSGAVVLWTLPTGHSRPTPAVSARGDLFEAGWGSAVEGVSDAGTPRWRHDAPGQPAGLSVTPSSVAFVAGSSGVEAYDASGERVWAAKPARNLHAGSAAGPEGNCYVADNLHLYALDPRDGHVAWIFADGPASDDRPAVVGSDGTVYYATANDAVVALDAAGHRRWKNDDLEKLGRPLFEDIATRLGVDGHGNAYFGARDGTLRALDGASGHERWRLPLAAPKHREAAPDVDGAGTVYATGGDEVVAVDEGGAVRWGCSLDGAVPTQLVASPKGGVVLAFENGTLRGWDGEGNATWRYRLPSVDSRPAFGPRGEVYAGSGETLYALAPLGSYSEPLARQTSGIAEEPGFVIIDGVRVPVRTNPA